MAKEPGGEQPDGADSESVALLNYHSPVTLYLNNYRTKEGGMIRSFMLTLLIIFLLASNAVAGFGSYSSPYSSDGVVAPIQIMDKGIYNLVVAIQFLNEPYEQKVYESDEYKNFIRRLKVEWSGVALRHILKAEEQSINDLAVLKGDIEKEIEKLADQLKNKYSLQKEVEVVFSLSNFFLLEPKN